MTRVAPVASSIPVAAPIDLRSVALRHKLRTSLQAAPPVAPAAEQLPDTAIARRYWQQMPLDRQIASVASRGLTAPFQWLGDAVESIKTKNTVVGGVLGFVEGVVRLPQAAISSVIGFIRKLVMIRSFKQAFEAVVQLVISALATIVTPFFHMLKRVDDVRSPPESLDAGELEGTAGQFSPRMLEKTRVHRDSPLFNALSDKLGLDIEAFTIGRDLYGSIEWDAAHELVHSLQYRDAASPAAFLGEYWAELLGNVVIGKKDVETAYTDLSFEAQARQLSGEEHHRRHGPRS